MPAPPPESEPAMVIAVGMSWPSTMSKNNSPRNIKTRRCENIGGYQSAILGSLPSLRRHDPDQVRRVGGSLCSHALSAKRTPGNHVQNTMEDAADSWLT